MDHFEMVEKLREKANVSYEEAKAALEACDWDMLDALVLLESEGKVTEDRGASYSTEEKKPTEDKTRQQKNHFDGKKLRESIASVIAKASSNFFVVKRHGNELFRLPLIALALIAIFLFRTTLVALVIGLFCGARYSFEGSLFAKSNVNHVMDKAADTVDNIKNEVGGNDKE